MAINKDDLQVKIYCAQVMLPHIETLKKKNKAIQRRRNIEDIHDLRVSSRRIRTCLAIFYPIFPQKKLKIWQRDIKQITKSFGQVRDLDVQIDLITQLIKTVEDRKVLSGLKRVRLRLKQKRQIRQAETQAMTKSILDSPSLIELEDWTKTVLNTKDQSPAEETENDEPKDLSGLYHLAYEHIQKRLDEFLFYEVFIFDPDRIEELHQMRIAAKQLRYTLEVFSALYEQKSDFALDIARESQQILGEIHDADVWGSFIPKFTKREQERILKFYGYRSPFNRLKPGIDFLLENRQVERGRLYQTFLTKWKNWKMKETWLNLRKVIFLTNYEG